MSVLGALGASFSLSLFVGRVEGAPQWKDGGGKRRHVPTLFAVSGTYETHPHKEMPDLASL